MNINEAIVTVNSEFVPVPDLKDKWTITGKGDCEDYALRTIWHYSDQSKWKMIWNILTGKFRLWYSTVSGDGHLVTEHTPTALFFDNRYKRLTARNSMWDTEIHRPFGRLFVGYKILRAPVSPHPKR